MVSFSRNLVKPAPCQQVLTATPAAVSLLVLLSVFVLLAGCERARSEESDEKVAYLSMRTAGPNTLDPVQGATQYDNRSCAPVYQTLLQYKYFHRPVELVPLLAAEMPEVSEDGKVYRFQLRKNVFFIPIDSQRDRLPEPFFLLAVTAKDIVLHIEPIINHVE